MSLEVQPALRACVFALVVVFAGDALAHGGQYRGPSIGGVDPGMIAGGPATGGRANLDVSSWRVWWQLNHDRYVKSRRSAVVDVDRRAIVLPALKKALDATKDADINSACLVALGKAAVDHPDFDVLDVLRARLSRGHMEVREAAVLALGISGRSDVIETLDGLLRDTPLGRKLVRRERVGSRTRTFAAYAMGILAQRSTSGVLKGAVLDSLLEVLGGRGFSGRNVLTGVLNAMRMIGVDPARGAAHKRLLWVAMGAIHEHQKRRFKDHRTAVQSHGLTALAGLVGRGDSADHQLAKRLVVDSMRGRGRKDGVVQVSAIIALGEMLRPGDTKELEALLKAVTRPADSLAPRFAMIALGKIGGEVAFKHLERGFRKGKRGLKAWAAIGLGLMAFHAEERPVSRPQARKKGFREEIGEILHKGLKTERDKDLLAAIAIGLGLTGHQPATGDLRKLAVKYGSLGDFAGPLSVSLAMLGHSPSLQIARDGMGNIDLPLRFAHAGLALAIFDRPADSALAVAVLQRGDLLRRGQIHRSWFLRRLAAAAQAIGYLKNPQDIVPLAKIVRRGRKQDLASAFAAAALGSVADRDPLGFGARIAHGMNYAARAQTISDGRNGILDIF